MANLASRVADARKRIAAALAWQPSCGAIERELLLIADEELEWYFGYHSFTPGDTRHLERILTRLARVGLATEAGDVG